MIEALFLLFLIINEDLILISATDFLPIGSHTDQKKTLHPMLTLGTDISRSSCHDYILVSPEKYLFREVKSVRCGFDLRDWAHTSIGLHRTFLVAITFLFDLKSLYHSLPQTSQATNLKLIRNHIIDSNIHPQVSVDKIAFIQLLAFHLILPFISSPGNYFPFMPS